MKEAFIWRAVLWTVIATAVVALVASMDPGFGAYYEAGGIVPVSTGERIEVLVLRGSVLSRDIVSDLYFLQRNGAFAKAATFDDEFQCVTDYQGQLFVTWRDPDNAAAGGSSSLYKDGKWVRAVSAPADFDIVDVAPFRDTVYAVGMERSEGKLAFRALGQDGWEPRGPALDAAREPTIVGCQPVGTVLDVVYCEGSKSALGMPDLTKARWYRVSFDGDAWSVPQLLNLPAGHIPGVSSFNGELALTLIPVAKDEPVKIVLVKDVSLVSLAEVPTKDRGRITSAWLTPLDGRYHVFLASPGRLWDVQLAGSAPNPAKELLSVGEAAMVRSRLYVALLGICAVMLVSLGVTWLIVRVRNFGRRQRTR